MEIYGFEKLGSHHQLLIWDRKDTSRYHHKIPALTVFLFEFLLDAKLSHDRQSAWRGAAEWSDLGHVTNQEPATPLGSLSDLIQNIVALFWSAEDSFCGVYTP